MTVPVKFSVEGGAPQAMDLPFWADHFGTGELAAEAICKTVFANDNRVEPGTVILTILAPPHIAGTYEARLERVLEVYASKKDAA